MVVIETNQNPDKETLDILSEGIQSFNDSKIGADLAREPDHRFIVVAKDKGAIIGGIRANAFWNYLDIELLWLDEKSRGKGLGSKLLKEAENFAKDKGFEFSKVYTASFQAEDFYKKNGYNTLAKLKDHPKGHDHTLLVKKI